MKKKYSTSDVIRQMQIKTKRFCYILTRMTKIQNTENTECQGGCGATGSLIHCWLEGKMAQPLWTSLAVSY